MPWVTLGKSRVRESRPPGSVRAKAKWLSYSTTTEGFLNARCGTRHPRRFGVCSSREAHDENAPSCGRGRVTIGKLAG